MELSEERLIALKLIEKVYEINTSAGEYLLVSYESVPEGESRGRNGYKFANNLNSTFTWDENHYSEFQWGDLYGQIGVVSLEEPVPLDTTDTADLVAALTHR